MRSRFTTVFGYWLTTLYSCSSTGALKDSTCTVVYLPGSFDFRSRILAETKLDVTRPLGTFVETQPLRLHPNIVRTANGEPAAPRRTSIGINASELSWPINMSTCEACIKFRSFKCVYFLIAWTLHLSTGISSTTNTVCIIKDAVPFCEDT